MAQVGIVMGSDSDLPVMSKAAQMLDKFGISYEVTVISAHRMPDIFFGNKIQGAIPLKKRTIWNRLLRISTRTV